MQYKNVELHNIAELVPENGGMRLQRVPEDVRQHLNPGAMEQVLQPANCEIRFVSESPEVKMTLSAREDTSMAVFHGCFDTRQRYVIGPDPVTVTVPARSERLEEVTHERFKELPFASNVCRLMFGVPRHAPLALHDIEGAEVRPPRSEEKPNLRYLAYCTSITHGFFSEAPHLNYAAQTARRLGADLINLGVAGACHCEKEFADYIAGRDDWQVASLALSVNMHQFDMTEFQKRVKYMVDTVAGADTKRPVACITLYPYYRDFGLRDEGFEYGGTPQGYRHTLREVVRECTLPNVHLFEGPDILPDITGLSADLVHPSDCGMIDMGRNLSSRLLKVIAGEQ